MARTTGTVPLRDLIVRGPLTPGEALEIRRRSAPPLGGVLQPDGTIEVSGRIGATPSTAARLALGGGAVDGWLRWRVPRLAGRSLAELREALAGEREGENR